MKTKFLSELNSFVGGVTYTKRQSKRSNYLKGYECINAVANQILDN